MEELQAGDAKSVVGAGTEIAKGLLSRHARQPTLVDTLIFETSEAVSPAGPSPE